MNYNQHHIFHDIIIFLLFLEMGSVFSVFFLGGIISMCILALCFFYCLLNNKKISQNLVIAMGAFVLFFVLSSIFTRTNISLYYGLAIRLLGIIFIYSVFDGCISLLKISLKRVLQFIAVLGLLNIILINIIPELFSDKISATGFSVNTLFYIFNYNSFIDIGPLRILRNQGMFWEPGVFQITMNILLYILLIEEEKPIAKCLLPIFLVVSTFSTTGFLVMGLIVTFAMHHAINHSHNLIREKLLIFLFTILLIPMIYTNINHKVAGDGSKSTAMRTYDLYMGINLIAHNPIWGIGPDPKAYLANTKDINMDVYEDIDINVERGNTNTIVSCACYLGIPFTLYFWRMIYHQQLFRKKRLFFSIFVIMFLSEPLFGTLILFLISMSSKFVYK